MGKYQNKLDKKYFHKSIYIATFKNTFPMDKITLKKQYDIIYETLNTLIILNNIIYSKNYKPKIEKINNSLYILDCYLKKYKTAIKKCYDLFCIDTYNTLFQFKEELEDIKSEYENRKVKIYLTDYENYLEFIFIVLNSVNFDFLLDYKKMIFKKNTNDKLPKKYNCKIIYDIDIKKNALFSEDIVRTANNLFDEMYFNDTGVILNDYQCMKKTIYTIHNLIKDINNAFVDYYIYNDNCILKLIFISVDVFINDTNSTFNDIRYMHLFNILKDIYNDVKNNNLDFAYKKVKNIIARYNYIYERIC